MPSIIPGSRIPAAVSVWSLIMNTCVSLIFALIVANMFPPAVSAEPVVPRLARSAAETFIAGNPGPAAAKIAQSRRVTGTTPLTGDTGEVVAYIHSLEPEGFVITSADTRVRPVLGWSGEGAFDFGDEPGNLLRTLVLRDMSGRLDLPGGDAGNGPGASSARNAALWREYAAGCGAGKAAAGTVLGPLIHDDWGQEVGFNAHCPIDPATGVRSVAGCVAVALGQMFSFWRRPDSLSFTDDDAYVSNYDDNPIAIPEDADRLDFPDFGELNEALANIDYDGGMDDVAMLLFGAGIKQRVNYSSEGSGSPVHIDLLPGLGYGAVKLSTDWAGEHQRVIDNLADGIPCALALFDRDDNDQHAAICDGYDESTGMFHINLGWGNHRNTNTWYALPVIHRFDLVTAFLYDFVPDDRPEFEHISGRVLDGAGAPVPLATVEIDPGSRHALTDGDGGFSLLMPASPEKTVTVHCPGHAVYHGTFTGANITVTLEPALDPTLAEFHFDGDGTDSSGRGNDLLVDPLYTDWVEGKYGRALSIASILALRSQTTTGLVYPGAGDLTVEAWGRVMVRDEYIVYVSVNSPPVFYLFIDDAFRARFYVLDDEGQGVSAVSGSLDGSVRIGDWVHLAGVYREGEAVEIYVNGRLAGRKETTLRPATSPHSYLDVGFNNGVEMIQDPPVIIDEARISYDALEPGSFIGGEFTGALTITVTAGDAAEPLPEALVTVEPGGYSTVTDERGLAVFDSLPARRDYRVTAAADGDEQVAAEDVVVTTGLSTSLVVDTSANTATGVDERPAAFALHAPFPNPFNAGFTVAYSLSEESPVTLILYSVSGQAVRTITPGRLGPGMHTQRITGDGLANGVFFLKLEAGRKSTVKKIVHVK